MEQRSRRQYKHSGLTAAIIKANYEVYNDLGYGFLEKVYENALAIALRKCGHMVVQQAPIHVYYQGAIVGDYFADLLVDDLVIVEIKAAKDLAEDHKAQLLNYLRATPYEVGLLVNFGPEPRFVRRAFDNDRKQASWAP